MSLRVFYGRPEDCRALQSAGESTNWCWLEVMVVDTKRCLR